jgi:hypothetical protein
MCLAELACVPVFDPGRDIFEWAVASGVGQEIFHPLRLTCRKDVSQVRLSTQGKLKDGRFMKARLL